MYAPLNSIQEREEVSNKRDNTSKHNFGSEISPNEQQEDKLASPLPVERTNNPLPPRTRVHAANSCQRVKNSETLEANHQYIAVELTTPKDR